MSRLLDSNCLLVHIACLIVQRGDLTVDPITDLFQSMQIVSVVHARLEATAPWGLKPEADVEEGEGKHSAADSAFQFAHFGMLTRGNCWLTVGAMPEALPGSDLVVNRLADVLFIQCLRAHIASRSEACNNGLLRAIFDPQIGVALKSMHEKVDAPWTVETLAAASGMSRSAFAVRFKEMVGETPLEYLTSWRMQNAAALLQKGDRKLIDVAKAVGYDSDAAFSKAFKRVLGVPPRHFRR